MLMDIDGFYILSVAEGPDEDSDGNEHRKKVRAEGFEHRLRQYGEETCPDIDTMVSAEDCRQHE